MGAVLHHIAFVLYPGLIELALIAPFIGIVLWLNPFKSHKLLWLLAAFAICDQAVLRIPDLPLFAHLAWNWQGKILEIGLVALFIIVAPGMSLARIGVRTRLEPGSVKLLTILLVVLTIGVVLLVIIFPSQRVKPDIEMTLFHLSVPGIAEELVFRGVCQSLLNEVFGRRWRLWGVTFGWGLPLTAMYFGIIHGVLVSGNLNVSFDWLAMIITCIGGLAYGLLRERTGTVWPGMVLHNWLNTLQILISAVLM